MSYSDAKPRPEITGLIQASGEDVDDVSVGGGSVGQCFVVLERLLHVLSVVLFDVVVTADGKLELVADDHAGPLRAGTADEQHDAPTGVGESGFEETDGDGESHACRYIGPNGS